MENKKGNNMSRRSLLLLQRRRLLLVVTHRLWRSRRENDEDSIVFLFLAALFLLLLPLFSADFGFIARNFSPTKSNFPFKYLRVFRWNSSESDEQKTIRNGSMNMELSKNQPNVKERHRKSIETDKTVALGTMFCLLLFYIIWKFTNTSPSFSNGNTFFPSSITLSLICVNERPPEAAAAIPDSLWPRKPLRCLTFSTDPTNSASFWKKLLFLFFLN